MNEQAEQLILLLRSHLLGADISELFPDLSEGEWLALYNLSVTQRVFGFAYESICAARLPVTNAASQLWQERTMSRVLYYFSLRRELLRVSCALKNIGIDAVLLKGLGTASLYPKPELRSMGDIDIWISGSFYEAALCLEKLGYKARKTVSVHHIEFASNNHLIELHYSPAAPTGHKKTDRQIKLFDLKNASFSETEIDGVNIHLLSQKDSFKIAVLNLLKHFVHDRITLCHICDILILLMNTSFDDRQEIYQFALDCGLGDVFSSVVSMLVYKFGISPDSAKGIPLISREDSEKFADDILSVDNMEKGIEQYYSKLRFGDTLRLFGVYLKAVRRDMLIKYPYCRKKVYLRPLAFLQAYMDYIFEVIQKYTAWKRKI